MTTSRAISIAPSGPGVTSTLGAGDEGASVGAWLGVWLAAASVGFGVAGGVAVVSADADGASEGDAVSAGDAEASGWWTARRAARRTMPGSRTVPARRWPTARPRCRWTATRSGPPSSWWSWPARRATVAGAVAAVVSERGCVRRPRRLGGLEREHVDGVRARAAARRRPGGRGPATRWRRAGPWNRGCRRG